MGAAIIIGRPISDQERAMRGGELIAEYLIAEQGRRP
jgi:hypothetical protein